MPEVSLSVVITIVVAIFSAGITWGVMRASQKSQAEKQEDSEEKIETTVTELKALVNELKTLASELQVMKALSVRSERDIERHEQRIQALEIAVAKLQDKP